MIFSPQITRISQNPETLNDIHFRRLIHSMNNAYNDQIKKHAKKSA